jgi:hypothetical protein
MRKCPICKSDAEELDRGTFDGFTIQCSTHGEVEFSDTARSTRWECRSRLSGVEAVLAEWRSRAMSLISPAG